MNNQLWKEKPKRPGHYILKRGEDFWMVVVNPVSYQYPDNLYVTLKDMPNSGEPLVKYMSENPQWLGPL